MPVPEFVTHYHLADRSPFLSLSELSDDALGPVLADLGQRRVRDGGGRVFGPRYMALRRLTESRLHQLFRDAGGRPERTAPHYFVLGVSDWFAELSPDTCAVTMRLDELPDEAVSFTYPDSFTSMGYGPRFGVPYQPRTYHGKVFRLHELPDVIAEYGMPQVDSDHHDYHRRPFENYIEIQLWSDTPIQRFREPHGGGPASRGGDGAAAVSDESQMS
ncbi:MAG: hypothetical protein ACRDT6_01630 [Micromonosporaceae bacterium]